MRPQKIRITPATRAMCVQAVASAPDDWVFTPPTEPTRSLDQNARMHAMFADIARQYEFFGSMRDVETVKRLLVDAFARAKAKLGEPLEGHGHTLPSLDGRGVVQLGIQTRYLSKALVGELIEYLYYWGAENGVRFSDAKADIPEWV